MTVGPIEKLPRELFLEVLEKLDLKYLKEYGTSDAFAEAQKWFKNIRLTCRCFRDCADSVIEGTLRLGASCVTVIPVPGGFDQAIKDIDTYGFSIESLRISPYPIAQYRIAKNYVESQEFAEDLRHFIYNNTDITVLTIELWDHDASWNHYASGEVYPHWKPYLWCTIIDETVRMSCETTNRLKHFRLPKAAVHWPFPSGLLLQITDMFGLLRTEGEYEGLTKLELRGITEDTPSVRHDAIKLLHDVAKENPNLQRLTYGGMDEEWRTGDNPLPPPSFNLPNLTYFELEHAKLVGGSLGLILLSCPRSLKMLYLKEIELSYNGSWNMHFDNIKGYFQGTKLYLRGLMEPGSGGNNSEKEADLTIRVALHCRNLGWDCEVDKSKVNYADYGEDPYSFDHERVRRGFLGGRATPWSESWTSFSARGRS